MLAKKYPKDKRFCHNALVFAPDKTVLESLREIMTFDKSKVVPPEYARVLDSNIKFHFLIDSGVTLHTIDDSDFNIVISNNQKIIVKKKRKEDTPIDILFGSGTPLSELYGDDEEGNIDVWDDSTLMDNQRFKKLCRLPQLGVYVDEAHHLFGANLEKELRSQGLNKTTLRNTINMLAESTSIVACYNYTGTPYVNKQVLPEVVYAYGLNESIRNGFLKDADPIGFENVKNEALSLVKYIKDMELHEIMAAIKKISEYKLEINDYFDIMAIWYRDVLLFKATQDVNHLVFREELTAIRKCAQRSSYEGIENIVKALDTAKHRLDANVNFELVMELLLLTIQDNG